MFLGIYNSPASYSSNDSLIGVAIRAPISDR